MLVNRRLLLPRLSALKKVDPWECSARRDYANMDREQLESIVIEIATLVPTLHLNALLSAHDLVPKQVKAMSLDELKQAAWFLEHSRFAEQVACSCWYGTDEDSDAMWRLYCSSVGVAITSSPERLKRSVKCSVPAVLADEFELTLAEIDYQNTDLSGNREPWLIKRKAFEPEKEIRLYVDYPLLTTAGFSLSVDPIELIERIVVTPYAPKWQCQVVEQALRELPAARTIKIEQSSHRNTSEPAWPANPFLRF